MVRKHRVVLGFFVGLAVGLLIAQQFISVPAALSAGSADKNWKADFFAPLGWAVSQIDARYVEDVEPDMLCQAALEGMMNRLDDYSDYIPQKRFKEFQDDTKGAFGGIGIHIRYLPLEKTLKVEQAIPGTPAFREGVLAGDIITRIREESSGEVTETIDFKDVHDAVRVLRGEVGTKVTITVIHRDNGKAEDITITREVIRIPGVRGVRMVDEESRIAYVYIANFHEHAAEDLYKAITELQEQGMEALIIDLRFNPGGLLKSSIEISDMFLSEGVIVSTRGRSSGENVFTAEPGDMLAGMPIVILVNRYSASASEIVTGALKDHRRAIIVGERTFGKGSVQTILDRMGEGGALKLTTARYYTPNGVCIEKVRAKPKQPYGIKPHIEMELSAEDIRALASALAETTSYPPPQPEDVDEPEEPESPDAPDADSEDAPDAAEEAEPFRDAQLERSVDILKGVLVQRAATVLEKAAAR